MISNLPNVQRERRKLKTDCEAADMLARSVVNAALHKIEKDLEDASPEGRPSGAAQVDLQTPRAQQQSAEVPGNEPAGEPDHET